MKTHYNYITAILIFFTLTSFSQGNFYFQNYPEWSILMQQYSGSDCTGYQDLFNYYLNGDTVLNSFTYKKIYKKGIASALNINCQPYNDSPYNNSTASFYLRSLDKKMFLRIPGDTAEKLLYDFNLHIGDTLPATYTYTTTNHTNVMVVTAIDSINTPNGYLKRFALSGGNDTLYEGAGSTGGLIEPVFPLFLSGYHHLTCYSLNDAPYFHSIGISCDLGVGLPNYEKEKPLVISPNPFSDKTILQFNHEIKNASLSVFDIHGIILKTINFSGNSLTFEKGILNPGLYFYKVETDKSTTLTGKLIIID